MAIVYGLKVNLSVAMVIMVNSTHFKLQSLEGRSASCNATLLELQTRLSNQTEIQYEIGNTTQLCSNITEDIKALKAKEYTEYELNEVNNSILPNTNSIDTVHKID